jgi:hypothetical protein
VVVDHGSHFQYHYHLPSGTSNATASIHHLHISATSIYQVMLQ